MRSVLIGCGHVEDGGLLDANAIGGGAVERVLGLGLRASGTASCFVQARTGAPGARTHAAARATTPRLARRCFRRR